jgi:hypothetical protein
MGFPQLARWNGWRLAVAISDFRFQIWDSGFGIRDSGFGIRDLGFGIWDLGYGIRDFLAELGNDFTYSVPLTAHFP